MNINHNNNLKIGDKLRDRYEIIKPLEEGAFGNTYLAKDGDKLNTFCVVKQLKIDVDNYILHEAKRLFDQEAETLHKLEKYEQIPKLLAHFNIENDFYLVQEFIEGNDLTKEIIPEQKWSENKVINLIKEILEVLIFVHSENIIHRDLKPANIMRRKKDQKIVLIDFGAVKVKEVTNSSTGTVVIGTKSFMPFEQRGGKPELASDIYAVGIIAILALTGLNSENLPDSPNIDELDTKFNLNLTKQFKYFLAKMLKEYHLERFQNAKDALKVLNNLDSYSEDNSQESIDKTRIVSPKYEENLDKTIIISPIKQYNLSQEEDNQRKEKEDNNKLLPILITVSILSILISVIGVIIPQINRQNNVVSENNKSVENNPTSEKNNQDNSSNQNEPLKDSESNIKPQKNPSIDSKYQDLQNNLKSNNWQEAEKETNQVLLSLVGRKNEDGFTTEAVENLPCEDLKTINQLWQENSNNKFGFTTQKEMYLATGNTIGKYQADSYQKFVQQVGWDNSELTYTDKTPKGHLPAPLINGYEDVWHDDTGLLFSRLQSCGL